MSDQDTQPFIEVTELPILYRQSAIESDRGFRRIRIDDSRAERQTEYQLHFRGKLDPGLYRFTLVAPNGKRLEHEERETVCVTKDPIEFIIRFAGADVGPRYDIEIRRIAMWIFKDTRVRYVGSGPITSGVIRVDNAWLGTLVGTVVYDVLHEPNALVRFQVAGADNKAETFALMLPRADLITIAEPQPVESAS